MVGRGGRAGDKVEIMDIGIGLPNPRPGISGQTLLEFARRAEGRGFSGLGTIDRLAYPTHDSLITLAAAAGATSRIRLLTNVLLAPLYPSVLLAKSAASLDQLSGGRFTLGVAPGGRTDDFELVGRDFHTRGRDFDDQLELMHRTWRGEPVEKDGPLIAPQPVNDQRVPILIGGGSDRAVQRAVTWGAGWTVGGGPIDAAVAGFEKVRRAWQDAGRAGEPRLAAMQYFSLGSEEESRTYLREYYSFLGPYAELIANAAHRTPDAIRGAAEALRSAGCTELYFVATTDDPDDVDRLADIVL
jgi:alkanesulfonate monooxygenase SsuD/methylene tetrahydromethanopterin reductase-like flavin-dependent oxidoreductase (luciferase family)